MPRFIVLQHTQDENRHFDLMLEEGEALLTFSFEEFPSPGMSCKSLFDHRLDYLDYEGEISGGRGSVRRVESGSFDCSRHLPDCIHVSLRGSRLAGDYRIIQGDDDGWTLESE